MTAPGAPRAVADVPGARRRTLSYGEALRDLQAAQKSSKGAPAYSRFVNRPLGRRFAAAAYRLGATPNVVTAVSACFSPSVFHRSVCTPGPCSNGLMPRRRASGFWCTNRRMPASRAT